MIIGLDIIDASLLAGLAIALLAGLMSFASPCVLPVVPAYLAYMSGMSFSELQADCRRKDSIVSALAFALGLSVVFVILGLAAAAAGSLFLAHQKLLGQLAGGMILIFGAHFLGVLRIPILNREYRPASSVRRRGGALGAFLLGLAFAFGWVPCIGPVLGAILALAAQEDSMIRGTLLLAAYAAGLGVPFVACGAYIGRSMALMSRIRPHFAYFEKAIGILLVGIALLLITGRFSDISFWILELAPWTAALG